METHELIEMMQAVVQTDIDAVHSYNRVLDDIADEVLRSRLQSFRDNHVDHIGAISDQIRSLGGKPPKLKQDLKGHVVEALAIVRTATGGTKNALKALRTAEEIANRHYARIVSKEVPSNLKDLLRRHFSDEKIHFDYINENVKVL